MLDGAGAVWEPQAGDQSGRAVTLHARSLGRLQARTLNALHHHYLCLIGTLIDFSGVGQDLMSQVTG